MNSVAVVGAGLSGLVCANQLRHRGLRVRVFDKARGVGGRMSSRRANGGRFDHGAQYFTVRDDHFARSVETWRRGGVVEKWRGEIVVLEGGEVRALENDTDRYVGVPNMSSICRHLATELEVTLQTPIGRLEPREDRWSLVSPEGSGLGQFDFVVISAPGPQTADLLSSAAPALAARASEAKIAPCWSTMVSMDSPLNLGFDGAFVHGSPLSWVARNTSKPGRPEGEAWVLHASPEWSQANLELEPGSAARLLYEAFCTAVGASDPTPNHLEAHRWRFALPTEPLAELCLFDPGLGLAACGDWCGGPRVEGAFLSGRAAADQVMTLLA